MLLFKGKKLLLDNFRAVLKDYSVDTQDVVRSAILDDIDISEYIGNCNPIKLDQIRLSMKEGISEEFYKYPSISGEMLYKIRTMSKEGRSLKALAKQMRSVLSEEHMKYLIQWTIDSVPFSNINMVLIPKEMLKVYDEGLREGIDMRKYHGIVSSVSPDYIRSCIWIEKYGKDSSFLCKDIWSNKSAEVLKNNAEMNKAQWQKLLKCIDSSDNSDRLTFLVLLVRNGLDIEKLQVKDENGLYVKSEEFLQAILLAHKKGMSVSELYDLDSVEQIREKLVEYHNRSGNKVHGRLIKKL